MEGTAGSSDQPTVAIDSIPDPIAGYCITDGEPVIRTRNEAFTTTFGTDATGMSVDRFIERSTSMSADTAEKVAVALSEGDPVDAKISDQETPAQRYRLQQLDAPVTSDADGYLLVSPRREPDSAGLASDKIASVISHDLRNPLDVATAHLRAARETGEAEHFDEIERSHDRMEQIIQDVLAVARGEQAVDVSRSVEVGEVATDAWSTVETDDATLTVLDDLPAIRADPGRLKRLFENLYRNSIEHARRDGDAGLESEGVDAESAVGDGPRITVGSANGGFFVADDGRGIPPADREYVFEPGYSTDGPAGGTGLGLTIVAEIAQAHGWEYSLTTSSNGGARFEFHVVPPAEANGH